MEPITPINNHTNKATYKQTWAVAFHFARANTNNYPAISVDILARRIWASMLSYYDDTNSVLYANEVSQYLDDQIDCPKSVLDRIIYNES